MKIVRCMTALALFVAVPVICGKDSPTKTEKEDYKTSMVTIPVTDENGNRPASLGVEGANYQTAATVIDPKEAKPKKVCAVCKEGEPVAEYKKKAKRVKVIAATVGKTFTIELPASPKLERSWKIYKRLSAKVEKVGEPQFIKGKKGEKYEGTMIFTFKATKPGKATITMKKLYPKGMKKPLKLRAFTIEIAK